MFCDEVTVHFIAGAGGKGTVSFRREKFVPRGGPNGGDGGKGGSIYLQADSNINTLAEFNTRKIFRGGSGENGGGKDKGGADATDLVLHVPVGTMVFSQDKKTILGDLAQHSDRLIVARGGRGGFGNAHFKSSTRQAPYFAELGEPGEEKKCVLELKLVADVGIIGLPSVGKSTLLSRISKARPKIADYHFTTLVPNLGFVTLREFGGTDQQNFLACDLPGLIEGAHKGKGLGIKFLKHVARNRILVHLIDVQSINPLQDYRTILNELKKFDRTLARKPQLLVLNKIDTVATDNFADVMRDLKKKIRTKGNIYTISCVTGEGLKTVLFAIWKLLERQKKTALKGIKKTTSEFKILRPLTESDPRAIRVRCIRKGVRKSSFEVTGARLEQVVVMTDFSNQEGLARVYDVCEKLRVNRELKRIGAKFGDEFYIRGKKLVYRW